MILNEIKLELFSIFKLKNHTRGWPPPSLSTLIYIIDYKLLITFYLQWFNDSLIHWLAMIQLIKCQLIIDYYLG